MDRIIAASEYHNFRGQLQDFTMLKPEKYASCKHGEEYIWFAPVKLLTVLYMPLIVDGIVQFKEQKMDLAFVHNFKVFQPVDEIKRRTG